MKDFSDNLWIIIQNIQKKKNKIKRIKLEFNIVYVIKAWRELPSPLIY